MAFPADFTLLGTLKVPVISTVSNIVLQVKFEDFTATMLSSLKADGGDLRISSDAAGLNRLPLEIENFSKTSGGTWVWVRVPSASTDTLIYVWGNAPAESQPLASDAFGSEATWVDYSLVAHGRYSLLDSSGNYTAVTSGSPTPNAVTGVSVNNTDRLHYTGGTLEESLSIAADVDITQYGNRMFGSTANWGAAIISSRDSTSAISPTLYYSKGSAFSGHGFIFDSNAVARGAADGDTSNSDPYSYFAKGTLNRDAGIANWGGTWRSYVGGLKVAENEGATTGSYNGQPFYTNLYVGAHPKWNNRPSVSLKNVLVKKFADTEDYASVEHSNQSATDAWFIAEDVGGGGVPAINTLQKDSSYILDVKYYNGSALVDVELKINNDIVWRVAT